MKRVRATRAQRLSMLLKRASTQATTKFNLGGRPKKMRPISLAPVGAGNDRTR